MPTVFQLLKVAKTRKNSQELEDWGEEKARWEAVEKPLKAAKPEFGDVSSIAFRLVSCVRLADAEWPKECCTMAFEWAGRR